MVTELVIRDAMALSMYPGIALVTEYVLPALGSGFARTVRYDVPMVLAKIVALMATDIFFEADFFNNNSPLIESYNINDYLKIL